MRILAKLLLPSTLILSKKTKKTFRSNLFTVNKSKKPLKRNYNSFKGTVKTLSINMM